VLDLEDGVAEAARTPPDRRDRGGERRGLGRQDPVRPRQRHRHALVPPRHRGGRVGLPQARPHRASEAEEAFDVRFVAALLDGIERARGGGGRRVGISALVETPKGVARADEIAAAHPRLETVIFGLGDYMAEMRTPDGTVGLPNPDYAMPAEPTPHLNDQWHYALARIANACRAAGVRPIDAVYATTATRRACAPPPAGRGRLGFDGKWAIHPDQVAPVNEVFSPDPARVEWARRTLALLERSAAAGAGAAGEGGTMVDAAHARMARHVLRQAGLSA
jgi:malyl-CoA/(S)-citramalyl-CoA lyase